MGYSLACIEIEGSRDRKIGDLLSSKESWYITKEFEAYAKAYATLHGYMWGYKANKKKKNATFFKGFLFLKNLKL